MLLHAEEFLADVERDPDDRRHSLVLMGQSGTGKSVIGRMLEKEKSYMLRCIDDHIEASEQLQQILEDVTGNESVEKLGVWLGQPDSPGYEQREEQYLALERSLMQKSVGSGMVVDTTGSAIYLEDTLLPMQKQHLLVHLEMPERKRNKRIDEFVHDSRPKPLCWQGMFVPLPEDNDREATVRRCFQMLMNIRRKLYVQFCDITIEASEEAIPNADAFIQAVYASLVDAKRGTTFL